MLHYDLTKAFLKHPIDSLKIWCQIQLDHLVDIASTRKATA